MSNGWDNQNQKVMSKLKIMQRATNDTIKECIE